MKDMGCNYCTSGLGEDCQGPLGLDDLEVSCDCECHQCELCGSAYCQNVGGPDPCEADSESYESD